MNITEKILAKASAKTSVNPGDIVDANVDMVMVHDLTGPLAVEAFKRIGISKVWDNKKIVIIRTTRCPRNPSRQRNCTNAGAFARAGHTLLRRGQAESATKSCPKRTRLPGPSWLAQIRTCTYGALGAFATGIGSTEAAAVLPRANLAESARNHKNKRRGKFKPTSRRKT
jgi:3-isopropylmalate/(R)-2-methylmalate dehydratase large subunit